MDHDKGKQRRLEIDQVAVQWGNQTGKPGSLPGERLLKQIVPFNEMSDEHHQRRRHMRESALAICEGFHDRVHISIRRRRPRVRNDESLSTDIWILASPSLSLQLNEPRFVAQMRICAVLDIAERLHRTTRKRGIILPHQPGTAVVPISTRPKNTVSGSDASRSKNFVRSCIASRNFIGQANDGLASPFRRRIVRKEIFVSLREQTVVIVDDLYILHWHLFPRPQKQSQAVETD
jgi:hypothetical protein